MKRFEEPKMNCTELEIADVITTSNQSPDEGGTGGNPGGDDM